jgi:NarL family two-component system response regulator LiaR
MSPIYVLLVEDHKLVREGTRQLLEQAVDIKVIGEVSTGEDAIQLIPQIEVDVILMDVHLPRLSGIETTKIIKENYPSIKILILSAYDDDRYVFPLLDAGASGYLLKTSSGDELIVAIRNVYLGQVIFSPIISSKVYNRFKRHQKNTASDYQNELSDRELAVLKEVAKGKTNKEIGKILTISHLTVTAHLKNIYSKLGMSSRAEAAAYAVNQGWITIEQTHS